MDSCFADPYLAVYLNMDPDPAAFLMRIRIQLNFFLYYKLPYEQFFEVEKENKDCSKVKKNMDLVQISFS